MMTTGTASSRKDYLEALYSELHPRLVRILISNLHAPDCVIEDACQTAWGALLVGRQELPPGSELGWLTTTATRVALRLMRGERRDEPVAELPEPARLDEYRRAPPDPQQTVEMRERIAEVRRLPIRQQRIVMLHGFGYEYEEIASVTGDSRRTVHRQLVRARQQLARLADE
jgi:RNA polymerase sigma factor (sigma-70 family)